MLHRPCPPRVLHSVPGRSFTPFLCFEIRRASLQPSYASPSGAGFRALVPRLFRFRRSFRSIGRTWHGRAARPVPSDQQVLLQRRRKDTKGSSRAAKHVQHLVQRRRVVPGSSQTDRSDRRPSPPHTQRGGERPRKSHHPQRMMRYEYTSSTGGGKNRGPMGERNCTRRRGGGLARKGRQMPRRYTVLRRERVKSHHLVEPVRFLERTPALDEMKVRCSKHHAGQSRPHEGGVLEDSNRAFQGS